MLHELGISQRHVYVLQGNRFLLLKENEG